MKTKTVIVNALLLLSAMIVNAQEIKYGAKLGFNILNPSNNNQFENESARMHINFGGFAEVKILEKFYFQPEVLYSEFGSTFKKTSYETSSFVGGVLAIKEINTVSKTKFSNLSLPLMGKYYISKKINVQFGPQVSFLVGAKNEDTNQIITRNTANNIELSNEKSVENTDLKKVTNSMDLGLNFGLGFDFTKNIFADLRYSKGLTNIIDKKIDGEYKVELLQLTLGYKF